MKMKMSNAEYQVMKFVSSHWLIEMLTSPAHCYRRHLAPEREIESPTDALRMGTLVHCLSLTPHRFEREFRVIRDSRRTRVGKECWSRAATDGLTPVKPSEVEKAKDMVVALKKNKSASRLLFYGKKERTIIQPRAEGLLPLKARLDVHQESKRGVVELKTIRDLGLVEKSMERYHYPLSAAFYRDMVRGEATTFVFVQSTPPHSVEIMDFPPSQLQEGREMYQSALRRFDACWLSGEWPEAEPVAMDDDPLMMPMPIMSTKKRPRLDVPVGELAL